MTHDTHAAGFLSSEGPLDASRLEKKQGIQRPSGRNMLCVSRERMRGQHGWRAVSKKQRQLMENRATWVVPSSLVQSLALPIAGCVLLDKLNFFGPHAL